jgi:hypothetical protein
MALPPTLKVRLKCHKPLDCLCKPTLLTYDNNKNTLWVVIYEQSGRIIEYQNLIIVSLTFSEFLAISSIMAKT